MADFGLFQSFHIDHGELADMSPQNCFVLGYELAHVAAILASGVEIKQPVHVENRERIQEACEKSGRQFDLQWMPDDKSESWLLLTAERKK